MQQRYPHRGRYRGTTLITRYQASREPHYVTSAHLSIVVWKMSSSREGRFVGVSQVETDVFVDYDYDLAGLEYEEIVGAINEIENVKNANVPVHKSKGNETIVNIANSVVSQRS